MADYMYLLESRLSQAQQNALKTVRAIAREKGLTVFLVGGAVRDLTSGSPVRDLDVAVQGNALKLKKDIEKHGGVIVGELEPGQALFVKMPGGVRLELGSTLTVTYPKPGKPMAKPATILDDLRRRDFTANAMALSLNEGSYGLLMDPLNGVADIENRELRLVSNYGFIEDPIRMVRAARLMARLGWQMDDKTAARYETGKQEGYISAASAFHRGYETEEIVHEEDPLRVLRRLESEGWMKELAPYWTAGKANEAELQRLRESHTHLQMQGIHPDPAAANFPFLTAKLTPAETAQLKASFPRQGFTREIEALDAEAKEFAAQFSGKSAALPSQAWKLLYSAKPEAVLMVAHSSKSAAIQARFKSFYTEWPQARQKVPYALMQEMRITPDLADYEKLVDGLTFELMDGKLGTGEEMKAYLEPFSPPAPPPPVHLRRPRAPKKESKSGKGRSNKAVAVDPESEPVASSELLKSASAPVEVPTAAEAKVKSPELPAKAAAKADPVPPIAPVQKAISLQATPSATKNNPIPAKTVVPAKAAAKSTPVEKKLTVTAVAKGAAPKKTAIKQPTPSNLPKKSSTLKPEPKVAGKGVAKPSVKTAPAKSAANRKSAAPSQSKKTATKPAVKKAVAKTPARPTQNETSKSAAGKKRR